MKDGRTGKKMQWDDEALNKKPRKKAGTGKSMRVLENYSHRIDDCDSEWSDHYGKKQLNRHCY